MVMREFFGNYTDYLDEKAFEENAVVRKRNACEKRIRKKHKKKTEKEKTKKNVCLIFEKQEWEVIEDEMMIKR